MKTRSSTLLKHNIETPNIFKKLFLGFFIIPLIPIIALIYLTQDSQDERQQAVEENIFNATQLISEKINSWIETNVYVSRLASEFADITSMDADRQKPLLEIIKNASPTTTAVRIDNADGMAIARSDRKSLKNYADRDYFKQVKEGSPIGQQVIFGKTQQQPLLCFTVPISEEDLLLGTLNQCATLDKVSTNVTDLTIGRSGFAFLVDNSNQLIAHGGKKDSIARLEDMSEHPAILHSNDNEFFTFMDADQKIIAYKQKTGLDWTLVIQQNYEEAFASPLAAQRNTMIIVALTLIASLLALYFLSLIISRPIQEARQQTDNILGAANDGLFLIDRNYLIGDQQSANLSDILRKEDLSGRDFIKYLTESVPLDTAQMAKDYIDLLFADRVKEALVQSRNPLKKVKTSIENKEGQLEAKYLSLTFKRVYRNGKITNLFVTAKDITNEIMMQEALDKAREEKDQQINLLADILYIPPNDLLRFLNSTELELKKINLTLEESGSDPRELIKKVNAIYRRVHKVKGDASTINLKFFASACHNFEELLEKVKTQKNSLSGNEFLPITMALDDLFEKCNITSELLEKLGSFSISTDSDKPDNEDETQDTFQPWHQLVDMANDLASKHQKEVEVHFKGFKADLPEPYQEPLKDVATQLMKNSLVHGIEPKEQRKKLAKIQQGQITLAIKKNPDESFVFVYMDDGQGIDYTKVREKLIETKELSEEKAKFVSDEALLRMIFKSGFTSRNEVDIDAGRGIGLSMVVEKVRELGGKIRVSSVPGKRAIFKIIIPAESKAAA